MSAARHDEQPVWIALNGVRRVVLSCSPHEPAALALGHVLAEGWLRSRADVHALAVSPDADERRHGVSIEIDSDALESAEVVRRHQVLHGCGLRHVLDCDPHHLQPVEPPEHPIDAVPLLRSLFAASDSEAPDGGVHAAALSDGTSLISISIDVARHCAVDRAIGLALDSRDQLNDLGLVCTARISGAMALKAVRARLGWIASRSIATALAREIAEAYGLLLLERAGRPSVRDTGVTAAATNHNP
ncbi:MAG TPA: formate dehydrogenase accessory sulfurtransferase FdhD [Longimicrobiales bacterium]|nr:formate dehydrogenase accessory sulfurtransferase FdhD [Longimicrobiales bacterium]